ncbi:PaaI family thioesterase [Roseisolibacter sp. H3M3-2]|uniref:PaaI family thioesterase n=1 Tax=Roseisolibacter sp. H3M3-2 TaxID=3031323 RepID=UPI0023DAA73E|nr:PaaI family thioesterase [Roseisolibacter sp. H3M3-2]MDF1504909.1 PaaI family thioesterase [Roseisolibacter sp. H3M3-2]
MAEPWIPIAEHPVGRTIAAFAARSYVSGDPEGEGLRVRYEARGAGTRAELGATAWFGPRTQGPPGHAHGGSTAALLDEAMGLAVWLAHTSALAAHIEVDFRAPVPLGVTARVETAVVAADERKASVTARLVGPGGELLAESRGVFVLVAERHASRFRTGGA